MLEEQDYPTFQYQSMDGSALIPLCPAGWHLPVKYVLMSYALYSIFKLAQLIIC